MKKFVTLMLPVLFAGSAFAADGINLQGREAGALLEALTRAGGYVDCGMGSCGTTASGITCSRIKHEDQGSFCTLSLQDETGAMKETQLTGAPAEALLDALVDSGVGGCGMESCRSEARSIDCTFSSNPQSGDESSRCSID